MNIFVTKKALDWDKAGRESEASMLVISCDDDKKLVAICSLELSVFSSKLILNN